MYILHHHTQSCTGCGQAQHWSHLYLAQPKGTGVELLPIKMAPGPDSAIFVSNLPTTSTPICFRCLPADASARGQQAQAAWDDMKRRKAQEARGPMPTAKKPLPPISTLA